ncbi:MAG: DUF6298 domain-containing protein [Blastocatellia bacterium]
MTRLFPLQTKFSKALMSFVLAVMLAAWPDSLASTRAQAPASGPLRVHAINKRYFADASGKVVYLTGSHNWDTFQRWFEGQEGAGKAGLPASFTAYLDVLQNHNHNFVRLWVAGTAWSTITNAPVEPQPYVRTGPGMAADGRPKFDLKRLNQAYFDELRSRVTAARDRGIYVSIMLFDSWGISEYRYAPHNTTWNYQPFNSANNINGIDGDPNRDGIGVEYHTLQIAAIRALQEVYVRKVVDTVNDLDNVLYEICNESGKHSTDWQYHWINFIKTYEATKPRKHPVGMTYQHSQLGRGTNANLFNSPADWISPASGTEGNYWDDPPAATGAKVIITDTDHIKSTSSDGTWIWRSFLRGLNPIVMDWWNGGQWDPIRRAMGHTRNYAIRMNLAAMAPRNELASTTYCLANPGSEYLVFQPAADAFTVTLASGTYAVEWFNTASGLASAGEAITVGSGSRSFTPPFAGAVLYLRR